MDELRLARRLALQLGVRWTAPATGAPARLLGLARQLRGAQADGRRGVTLWLRQAGEAAHAARAEVRDRRWRTALRAQAAATWAARSKAADVSVSPQPTSYGPECLPVLEGLEPARRRPA